MKEKIRKNSLILSGIFLIVVGIMLITFKEKVTISVFLICGMAIIFIGLLSLLKIPFELFKKSDKSLFMRIIIPLGHILSGIFLIGNAFFPTVLIAWFIAFYLFIIGCIHLFNFILLKKDGVSGSFLILFDGIIHFLFGIWSIFNISVSIDNIYLLLGVYLLFLGITFIRDGIAIFRAKNMTKLKRKIRVGLPVFLTAFIPHRALNKFNEFINEEEVEENSEKKDFIKENDIKKNTDNVKPDLEVWIHTSFSKNFDMIGHVDISYEGLTYSFGLYDVDSSKLLGTLGDGVLWTAKTENYEKWIKKVENRAVFRYGLLLTDEQKKIVENQIEIIKSYTYPFALTSETQYDSYLGKLQKLYHPVEIYKFKKSKFKTYFVLTTNCVLLADTIIGKTGIDIVKSSGIITPGAYQQYFEREYRSPHSNVISKSLTTNGKVEK